MTSNWWLQHLHLLRFTIPIAFVVTSEIIFVMSLQSQLVLITTVGSCVTTIVPFWFCIQTIKCIKSAATVQLTPSQTHKLHRHSVEMLLVACTSLDLKSTASLCYKSGWGLHKHNNNKNSNNQCVYHYWWVILCSPSILSQLILY